MGSGQGSTNIGLSTSAPTQTSNAPNTGSASMVAGLSAQTQTPATKSSKVKIKEPEIYNGKGRGGDAERFILSCENHFQAHPDDFPQDETQIQFTLSYLTDAVQAWGDVILCALLSMQMLQASADWDQFKKEFILAFSHQDKEGMATRKLKALTQGN
ncbi:hypothetical protein FRC01_008492 [Tulasnella sp. 417]|nr:hypothetical protein FRC01_008492 [Tulasnella sp. 417]